MKRKICRKCGKAFRGMGAVCDCVLDPLFVDRKGQVGIFQVERAESDWQEFCSAIDEVLNVTTDKMIPDEVLRRWLSDRCKSRKTKEDWTSISALYRDFSRGNDGYTVASFAAAITDSGYAISRGMVSRLILKEDYAALLL